MMHSTLTISTSRMTCRPIKEAWKLSSGEARCGEALCDIYVSLLKVKWFPSRRKLWGNQFRSNRSVVWGLDFHAFSNTLAVDIQIC
ncbi:hypothetical protein TNCT_234931 [Trichonephila clavata]|uniref:Uncharacterized protein n=1 Tax=Trichonephila clavata TaxID=2740835 RepID=A0A8X6G6I8_TRICU|nr:hypothetical protein TNCT_234931 [Trichonephila clavata]